MKKKEFLFTGLQIIHAKDVSLLEDGHQTVPLGRFINDLKYE